MVVIGDCHFLVHYRYLYARLIGRVSTALDLKFDGGGGGKPYDKRKNSADHGQTQAYIFPDSKAIAASKRNCSTTG